jgi:hypothetical protein
VTTWKNCRVRYLFSAVVNGSGKGSGIFFPFRKKGFHGAKSALKRHWSRKCRDRHILCVSEVA